MRIILFIFSVSCGFLLKAQTNVTKFYDVNWVETSKDKAAFYADFVQDGSNYNCTSYWINTKIVRGKSAFEDTLMQSATGLQVLYFKNGHVEDSSFIENKQAVYSYHYYPNNQLAAHYYLPANSKEGVSEGYDESGKVIKHYVFQKVAEFKGGQKAWANYLTKNATSNLPVKGDTAVTARVAIQFIVDENGDILKPKIYKSSGYKNVDNDALRLIADSPQWNGGILYNQPVKNYKVQPISYILQPEKK
ncbi:MAG: energy transducer TonB [Bacteroidota bacterium]|nr:energy transducer TonB [Bacteroidota bacterium]